MMVLHRFHFVANHTLKDKIDRYASRNCLTRMGAIADILSRADAFLEGYRLKLRDEDNLGQEVGADCTLYVRVSKNQIRRLKMIRALCHIKSVAVIVRTVLMVFFVYTERYRMEKTLRLIERYKAIFVPKRKKVYKKYHMILSKQFKPFFSVDFLDNYAVCTLRLRE